MNEELLKRRLKMIRAYVRGVRPYVFIRDIHSKTGDKISALRRDWSRRDQWLPHILAVEEGTALSELLMGLRELVPELWRLLGDDGVQDAVKLGVMRELKHLYTRQIEVLQSAGVIEKAPEKIEATGEPFIIRMWQPEMGEKDAEDSED